MEIVDSMKASFEVDLNGCKPDDGYKPATITDNFVGRLAQATGNAGLDPLPEAAAPLVFLGREGPRKAVI